MDEEKGNFIFSKDFTSDVCLHLLQACNYIKKETLAQVFFCEFCEISKNTLFTEHLWTTASDLSKMSPLILCNITIL